MELDEEADYAILISHRPETIRLYPRFDLAVSGHAHGGQVVIPKLLNGPLCAASRVFPKIRGRAVSARKAGTYRKPRTYRTASPPVAHIQSA
ncbi:MAG: hypothetical protein LBE74_00010 [Treponema sp.]|nr:hypothetical protein [Treponema sp.]